MKTPRKAEEQKKPGMGLAAFEDAAARQNEGHWFDLIHPVTGEPTGMRVKLAGPDSDIQKKARHKAEDRIYKANRLPALTREEIAIETLAAIIVDWEMVIDGEALPLTEQNAKRLLNAGTWIRAQVDAYAGSRDPYFDGGL